MKNIILFFLLFINFCSFGQHYSINSKLLKSGSSKIDTISVRFSVYKDKIETISSFEKSKFTLSVIYTKTGETYNEIITRENNSIYEYCYRENLFDFENGKAVNGEEKFYLSQSMNGIAGRFEEVNESYNKTLNAEFLKKYVVELFEKIKNYH